eukprot:1994735-Pyramimonas_sp.AAC.2
MHMISFACSFERHVNSNITENITPFLAQQGSRLYSAQCVPEVKRALGVRNSLDREEDVGSGSGDEEIAQARFAELRKQNDSAYREMLGAASRELLEQCSLDLAGQQKEAEKAKKAKQMRKKRRKAGQKDRKMTRPVGVFCMDVDSEDDSVLSLSPVRKVRASGAKRASSAGAA